MNEKKRVEKFIINREGIITTKDIIRDLYNGEDTLNDISIFKQKAKTLSEKRHSLRQNKVLSREDKKTQRQSIWEEEEKYIKLWRGLASKKEAQKERILDIFYKLWYEGRVYEIGFNKYGLPDPTKKYTMEDKRAYHIKYFKERTEGIKELIDESIEKGEKPGILTLMTRNNYIDAMETFEKVEFSCNSKGKFNFKTLDDHQIAIYWGDTLRGAFMPLAVTTKEQQTNLLNY